MSSTNTTAQHGPYYYSDTWAGRDLCVKLLSETLAARKHAVPIAWLGTIVGRKRRDMVITELGLTRYPGNVLRDGLQTRVLVPDPDRIDTYRAALARYGLDKDGE